MAVCRRYLLSINIIALSWKVKSLLWEIHCNVTTINLYKAQVTFTIYKHISFLRPDGLICMSRAIK